MKIYFEHNGNTIAAKVAPNYSQKGSIFIFLDRCIGELGYAIFLNRQNNQWVSNAYLESKYPDTFASLLSRLYQINSEFLA